MMPKDFPAMTGLQPRDEASWRMIGTKDEPKMDTRWETDALFDKVVAVYTQAFQKDWGLATHTIENAEGVRIYWGLANGIRTVNEQDNEFIFVQKAQVNGKTQVRIVLKPRPQ